MSSIREAQRVWQALAEAHNQGRRVALLTLIHVRGSAYRRPGAKMMMADDGTMSGTLSGGCLEGDLYAYAEEDMKTGRASLHHYDLTEDAMWGLGIGCKGTIVIWIEPVDPREPFWNALAEALAADQPVALGADLPLGNRFLVWPDGRSLSREEQPVHVDDTIWRQGSATIWEDGRMLDVMSPPARLVLAGAGHDAEPVARLALQAGFDVTVLDPRPHFNNPTRFPGVRHAVQSAQDTDPESVAGAYWVIMNHHQRRDEEALLLAARSRPLYLGVLGPLSRTEEMLAETAVEQARLPFYAPVGLNLGAETVDEVAISIVSELLSVRQGRQGGHLRGRPRIHAV
ncbi:MAG: XdhC family protein [Thermaerobacter sp.]|nr:XdhC family protein [Thermaerobacter sp.]